MKIFRRLILYEIIFLLFVFFIYFEFCFMVSDANMTPSLVSDKLIRPLIKATVDVKGNVVYITEEITFPDYKKEMWLNIPSNLYTSTKINTIEPFDNNYEFIIDDAAMHITFMEFINKIKIQYELSLENKRQILSYHNDSILLTQFLITPAPFVNGKIVLSKKNDFGDGFVYMTSDYEISLNVDSSYSVFAPGAVFEKVSNKQITYLFNAKEIRDFPVTIFKNPQVFTKKIRNVTVTYVNMPKHTHDYVKKAFDYIESKMGYYYFDEFFVIGAPINLQGMELSNMILISDNISKYEMSKIIYHEVFHQWFYTIIGTDQINEPFIDEGLVSYFANELSGVDTKKMYNDRFLEMSLYDYKSKKDYYSLAYNESAAYFSNLKDIYKHDFDILLKIIFSKYNGKIFTKNDLENEIKLIINGGI